MLTEVVPGFGLIVSSKLPEHAAARVVVESGRVVVSIIVVVEEVTGIVVLEVRTVVVEILVKLPNIVVVEVLTIGIVVELVMFVILEIDCV